MRRLLSFLALTLLSLTAFTSVAFASSQWCEVDPAVTITTPDGSQQTVYVDVSALGTDHVSSIEAAQVSYHVSANPSGTGVVLLVTVPNDEYGSRYATKVDVYSQPNNGGTLLASTDGKAGQPMVLNFTLSSSN